MNKDRIKELWADPYWRVCGGYLYWIVTKQSKWQPFKPLPGQVKVAHKVLREGKRRLLIPKARREGMSTVINLMQLDMVLHNKNFHSMIVDQNQKDASDKLVHRIQKAWEKLAESKEYGGIITAERSNSEQLVFSHGSMVSANTSGRGGTAVQFLHVSELGPIDFDDPKRADEIISGALPAADEGVIVIESTAKGPAGHFKRLCDESMKIPEDEKTPQDFDVLFFSWFDDPRHVQEGNYRRISEKINKYLDEIENECKITLTPQQRLWYQITKERIGDQMLHEYPSLLSECWSAPVDGAIYVHHLTKAREEGRVAKWHYNTDYPVWTSWDIGAPENTFVWFFQVMAGGIYLIDCQIGGAERNLETANDWAKCLRERDYNYAGHCLPHDARARKHGGMTWQDDLQKAGLKNCNIIEVQDDTWTGVDNMAQYVLTFGWFKAKAMIVCISSHDLNDNMTFQPVVDEHSNYKSKNSTFAISGLLYRLTKKDNSRRSLDTSMKGYDFFKSMSTLRPVYFYLHPTLTELNQGYYNSSGEKIIQYMQENKLNYIEGLKMNPDVSEYRDDIHLNDEGQRKLANRFFEILK